MSDRPNTPLLDLVNRPADLKQFSDAQLHQVAQELRAETISAVSVTGGHLGAGLDRWASSRAAHGASPAGPFDGSGRPWQRRCRGYRTEQGARDVRQS